MSAKDEAIGRLRRLPDNCSWAEVLLAVHEQATASGAWPGGAGILRELRAPYGAPEAAWEAEPQRETEGGGMRDYDVLIERDGEGIYVASVPALRGCHTQGRTLEQVLERVREAIEVCVEAGAPVAPTEFVGVRRVSVAA